MTVPPPLVGPSPEVAPNRSLIITAPTVTGMMPQKTTERNSERGTGRNAVQVPGWGRAGYQNREVPFERMASTISLGRLITLASCAALVLFVRDA